MMNDGRYVRPIGAATEDEEEIPVESSIADESVDQTCSVSMVDPSTYSGSSSENNNSDIGSSSSSNSETSDSDTDDDHDEDQTPNQISSQTNPTHPIPDTTPTENPSRDAMDNVRNTERIERMEKMIAGINEALTRFQPSSRPVVDDNPDNTWNLPNDTSASTGGNVSSSFRWDHIKPFTSGIPANKMWEEWNRYIENFEIAVSFSNMNDPVKRTQLLFLSVGSELQEIIKAAKLRPSLANPDCYKTFVANIKTYFRSMTDTAAEHEAFSRMRQESGESAVAFHARLMCKVHACNYSADDVDRFVRAQLLSGLRNRELVKQARIYGYETNFIVQSAAREDTYEAETRQQESSNVFEVKRAQGSSSFDRSDRKRPNSTRHPDETTTKQYRSNVQNPRSEENRRRCSRCSLFRHRNGQCPALGRKCNRCGKSGHFVAACRQRQVNSVKYEQTDKPFGRPSYPDEDKHDDKNQV